MISALKLVTVERGHDPRRLSLIVSGGAGPLFAAQLGTVLQCPRIFIPPFPGNFSAWGMLAAPPRFHLRRSHFFPLNEAAIPLALAEFDELAREASNYLGQDRTPKLTRFLDMRYAGQEHSVTVEADGELSAARLTTLFHSAHDRAYSFSIPDGNIEVTVLAVQAELDVHLVGFPKFEPPQVTPAERPSRRVYLSPHAAAAGEHGVWSDCPVFERHRLEPGWSASGPALIEESGSTTVVHPGHHITISTDGILCIAAEGKN